MSLFLAGVIPALDSNGNPISGARWQFTRTGTTTAVAVYSDDTLETSLGSYVASDAAGRFADIYLDDSVTYRARLWPDSTMTGTPIKDIDPYNASNTAGEGYVTPEQFGCPNPAGSTNAQPYIQEAIDYAEDNGLGVYFPQSEYDLWVPLRTVNTEQLQRIEDGNGHPICIHKRVELKAAPGGTTLNRKTPEGNDPNVYQNWLDESPIDDGTSSMAVWRGGGFVCLVAPTVEPADPYYNTPSPKFTGKWIFDGGIPQSDDPTSHYATVYPDYTLTVDGKGWDIYDKGIWCNPHGYNGAIEFDDLTITGFRGELVYLGGQFGGDFVGKRIELTQSDADGFNPGFGYDETKKLEVDYMRIAFTGVALEGSCGWRARIGTMEVVDCAQGGGIAPGTWPGATDDAEVDETAVLHIDTLIVTRTPNVGLNRNTKVRRAITTDCYLAFGNGVLECFGSEIDELTVRADRSNVSAGVLFWADSNVATTQATYRNRVRHLHCERTAYALANSKVVSVAVWEQNSLGDHNFVDRITGETVDGPLSITFPVLDFHVGYGDLSGLKTSNTTTHSHNVETGATIAARSPLVAATVTTSGYVGTYNLPASPATIHPKGAVISIRNNSSGTLFCSTSWTHHNRRMIHLTGTFLTFRLDGSFWRLIDNRQILRATVTKDVASIGAGLLGSEETFALPGARAGMAVTITPTDAIAANLEVVSPRVTADDTVGCKFRDLTGAGYDAASANYLITADWIS